MTCACHQQTLGCLPDLHQWRLSLRHASSSVLTSVCLSSVRPSVHPVVALQEPYINEGSVMITRLHVMFYVLCFCGFSFCVYLNFLCISLNLHHLIMLLFHSNYFILWFRLPPVCSFYDHGSHLLKFAYLWYDLGNRLWHWFLVCSKPCVMVEGIKNGEKPSTGQRMVRYHCEFITSVPFLSPSLQGTLLQLCFKSAPKG